MSFFVIVCLFAIPMSSADVLLLSFFFFFFTAFYIDCFSYTYVGILQKLSFFFPLHSACICVFCVVADCDKKPSFSIY